VYERLSILRPVRVALFFLWRIAGLARCLGNGYQVLALPSSPPSGLKAGLREDWISKDAETGPSFHQSGSEIARARGRLSDVWACLSLPVLWSTSALSSAGQASAVGDELSSMI